jgi:hypothetical protein
MQQIEETFDINNPHRSYSSQRPLIRPQFQCVYLFSVVVETAVPAEAQVPLASALWT